MKIKLLIVTAVMLLSFSSTSIANPTEQQLEKLNNHSNVALAQSDNSLWKLKPIQMQAAAERKAGKSEASVEEESTVVIIACWAVSYGNEKELREAADLVVKGQVVEELGSTFVLGKYSDYTTEVKFQIDKVYKGEIEAGDEIEVSQMGGYDGKVKVVSENTTYLNEQQEAVLFLRKNSDGKYRAINESEGVYVLEDGFYINMGNNKVLNQEFRGE